MKKVLWVMGGCFLGDQMHCIPFLNRLVNQGAEDITMITGTYAKPVTEFLTKLYPIKRVFYIKDNPMDLNTRKELLYKATQIYHDVFLEGYDVVYTDVKTTFEMIGINSEKYWWGNGFTMEETFILNDEFIENTEETKNQIIVQFDTVHTDKNVPVLKEISYPLPVVTIGGPNEFLYPGSLDLRGQPFYNVAKEMIQSKLFVGNHSVCACLAFYLGMKSIIVHPWKNKDGDSDFFKFARYRDNIIELIAPSKEEVELAIKNSLGIKEEKV